MFNGSNLSNFQFTLNYTENLKTICIQVSYIIYYEPLMSLTMNLRQLMIVLQLISSCVLSFKVLLFKMMLSALALVKTVSM